jgi:integrase
MTRQGQARTGEIKRTAGGWAIRFRDARGVRHQRGGFRTKAEAKTVLDDELRKARLGPLYRPDATLQELVDVYLEQYDGAPASKGHLKYNLGKATTEFGDLPIDHLDALEIARWRRSLPEKRRFDAHRALRQVLAAAMRWQWIDRNVALDIKNTGHARSEFTPFHSWAEVEDVAAELGPFGPFAIFAVGTGVRPEEAFGADWPDVDLKDCMLRVRRAFAKNRLKTYTKTERSLRAVPLRAKVVAALEELPHRAGPLFPNQVGGRIDINNWRTREWYPALKAAGVEHRRIYEYADVFVMPTRVGDPLSAGLIAGWRSA